MIAEWKKFLKSRVVLPHNPKLKNDQLGVTLLELMAGMLILSLAISGIVTLLIEPLNALEDGRELVLLQREIRGGYEKMQKDFAQVIKPSIFHEVKFHGDQRSIMFHSYGIGGLPVEIRYVIEAGTLLRIEADSRKMRIQWENLRLDYFNAEKKPMGFLLGRDFNARFRS